LHLRLLSSATCTPLPVINHEPVRRYELQRGTSVTSSQMDDSEQPQVNAIDLGNGDHVSVSQ